MSGNLQMSGLQHRCTPLQPPVLERLWDMDVARSLTAKDTEAQQDRSAGQCALEREKPVLVKTGTLMCYQLTDSSERSARFQGRLPQQPDLAWLEQKLDLSLAGKSQRLRMRSQIDLPI